MTIRRITLACAVLALSSAASYVQASTLTFEDLDPAPATYDVMPAPYSGLSFTNWFFGPDTFYTPASGVIDLFTDYADPADPGAYVITNNNAVTSATNFVFDGAWFSGYSGVTFELWNGANLVHTSGALADAPGVDPYGPTFLSSGYGGLVNKVVVSGVQGYFAMDDFTYHRDAASAVPEPATFGLAFLALAAAGLAGRRPR